MSDSGSWECGSVGLGEAEAMGLWSLDAQMHGHGAAYGRLSAPTIKPLEPPVLGPAESCWSTPGAFGDPGLSRQQKAIGGRDVSCQCHRR